MERKQQGYKFTDGVSIDLQPKLPGEWVLVAAREIKQASASAPSTVEDHAPEATLDVLSDADYARIVSPLICQNRYLRVQEMNGVQELL